MRRGLIKTYLLIKNYTASILFIEKKIIIEISKRVK